MPQIDYAVLDRGFTDLNPVQFGEEQCLPSHRFGPAVREFTLLHFCLSGRGEFRCPAGTFPVGTGEYFLIRPGEVTTYEADAEHPWHYVWLGFSGNLAARFEDASPVGRLPDAIFRELLTEARACFPGWESMKEEYLVTVLFRVYAALFSEHGSRAHYAGRAETLLRARYMENISIADVAASLSVDRRYLSRLFRARFGMTMQEYLICLRMDAACRFLTEGHTVAEAAILSGYGDPFNFSKMFRRRFGVSPGAYAKSQRRDWGCKTREDMV